MTKQEYNDINGALERIISSAAQNKSKIMNHEQQLAVVGSFGGFSLFLKEYYESHKTD